MEFKDQINRFIDSLPMIEPDKHFYIWGTGNTACLYQEGIVREKKLEIYGYADNNNQKWGVTSLERRYFRQKMSGTIERLVF